MTSVIQSRHRCTRRHCPAHWETHCLLRTLQKSGAVCKTKMVAASPDLGEALSCRCAQPRGRNILSWRQCQEGRCYRQGLGIRVQEGSAFPRIMEGTYLNKDTCEMERCIYDDICIMLRMMQHGLKHIWILATRDQVLGAAALCLLPQCFGLWIQIGPNGK